MCSQRSISSPSALPYRSLFAAIASISAVGIAIGLTIPLLSLILESRGISPTWIGINTAVSGLSSIIITPFVPDLARIVGTARLLIIALLIAIISFLGFYLIDAFWVWFILRFIFATCIGIAFILSEFWINFSAPEHKRGFIFGIYGTVFAMGFAAGPVILSLTGSTGFMPFLLGSLILFLSIIPVLLALDESPKLTEKASAPFISFLFAAPIVIVATLIFGAAETALETILPLFGQALNYDEQSSVLMITFFAIGSVGFQIPLGMLSDRMDRRLLLAILSTLAATLSLVLASVTGELAKIYGYLLLIGGFTGGLYTIALSHLGTKFKGSDLAAANSAVVLAYSIGLMIGPLVFGIIFDHTPPEGLPISFGIMMGSYALFAFYRFIYGRN